ncbi:hypothetical protein CUMW_281410 [Citrus unshiu]|uniref:Uncharacterized protein n=1 Tax=Citrus unshiu TaxID=55188 RepID=A0A2H5MXN4_CITUN|nr:hypothetical protein CUMW_281410 [Citrus unshiu]
MGHSNVWNSHPKTYGPGSRAWQKFWTVFHIHPYHHFLGMWEPSRDNQEVWTRVADSAFVAMPRRLVSLR